MKFTKKQKVRYVGLIAFAVLFVLTYWLMTGPLSSKTTVEKQLQMLSAGLSEKCPMMVDDITRLDSVRSQGIVLNYYYTLMGVDKGMGDFSQAGQQIGVQILEQVKTSPDMSTLRRNRVTFGYIYRDRNGTLLFELEIPPEQYR